MKSYAFFLMVLSFVAHVSAQTPLFVKHDASGSNNGTSWTDAFTGLHEALTVATTGNVIWVASGTYRPAIELGGSGDRFKAFQLKNEVTVFGGFAGDEDPATFDLDLRDFDVDETILSGDLGEGTFVYHVFRHVDLGLTSTAVLDGFTISGGKADGADPDNKGGGMLNSGSSSGNGSSPTIRNCLFTGNEATEGGAMYNSRYSNPAVSYTTFSNNRALAKGGAVFNTRNNPAFSYCTFSNNEVTGFANIDGGGAMYNNTQSAAEGPVISHCIFTNNTVPTTGTNTFGGGAIYSSINPGKLEISHSTFTGNTGKYGGAVFHSSGSDANRNVSTVSITNSTFEQNTAEYGGAIFSERHNTAVIACIIRGNQAAEQSGGYYGRNGSSRLINTLLSGNKAGKHGGGTYFNNETPGLINTTVTGNYSGERGGGISMIGSSTAGINNTIVWGNASPEGNELWLCSDCTANLDYSLYGNASGDVFITDGGVVNATNSLNSNPVFLNPYDAPTSINTPNVSGNYFICGCTSPAIDTGFNSHVPVGVTEDLRGTDRFLDGNDDGNTVVDLGAYEFDPNGCNALQPFSGDGSPGYPYEISMLQHLYWVAVDHTRWAYHYIQTADIDACNTQTWFDGAGWSPIGNATTPFIGSYDGGGFPISNLHMNRPTQELGLFGRLGESFGTNKGNVKDLTLVNVDISGEDNYIGGLAGYQDGSSAIENVHVTGSIKGRVAVGSGSRHVGGVIGEARGSLTSCSFSGLVRGHGYIGGLIGESRGLVRHSFSSGSVETNKDFSGGLIGRLSAGSVTTSYSTANITTLATYVYYAGGFIGDIFSGDVTECYSTGHVTGLRNQAGGFVGRNRGVINNCYARGTVTRNGGSGTDFGGFVGWNEWGKAINCYSTGAVLWHTTPHPTEKGFAGNITTGSNYEMTGNFWDTETSEQATTSGVATGETSVNLKTQSTFTAAGWDFANTWAMNPAINDGYPYLGSSLFTWSGIDGSNWGDTGNWDAGQVPGTGSNLYIPGSLTHYPVLDADRTAGNITVAIGGRITIPPNMGLTVSGVLTNQAGASGLLIQSDATGTGSLIHHTAGVSATIERFIPAPSGAGGWDDDYGWHLLSAPVTGQAISGFAVTPESDYDFYLWDEAQDYWRNFKAGNWSTYNTGTTGASAGGNFATGRGYMVAYAQTQTGMAFAGEVNTTDVSWADLSFSGTGASDYDKGWHLLGNPFASALDRSAGSWSMSNVSGVVKIWDEESRTYLDVVDDHGAPRYIIPAAQGFFVQVSDAGNGITIPSVARMHHTNTWYKSGQGQGVVLTAREAGNIHGQQTMILLESGASASFDFSRDGRFLAGHAPRFYSIYGEERLSTKRLPRIDGETIIQLGFGKNSASEFEIALDVTALYPGLELWLIDNKLDIEIPLSQVTRYAFSSDVEDDESRFALRFTSGSDNLTAFEGPSLSDDSRIWVNDNTLNVFNEHYDAMVYVYDLNGRLMRSYQTTKGNQRFLLQLPSGMYVVHAISSQEARHLMVNIR